MRSGHPSCVVRGLLVKGPTTQKGPFRIAYLGCRRAVIARNKNDWAGIPSKRVDTGQYGFTQ